MDKVMQQQSSFAFANRPPELMNSYHQHQNIEINLLVDGELTYLIGGARQTVAAGQFVAFWAAFAHRVIYVKPETKFYYLNLPLTQFLQWHLPTDFAHHLLNGEIMRELDASRRTEDLQLFARWLRDSKNAPGEWQSWMLLEMEARMRRLAHAHSNDLHNASCETHMPSNPIPGTLLADKIERMAAFVSEHYHKPLLITEIAAAVDLHPKYAMALFRKQCGMTLGEYVMWQRLAHAQRLLSTSDAKIIDVAFQSGFGSLSQFYEIFKRCCGQYPKDYRRKITL